MRILLAYDGSNSADAAVEDLQRTGLPKQAETLVVTVADRLETTGLEETQTVDGSCRSRLADAEALSGLAGERIRASFPQWTVSSRALWGSPAKVLLETAGSWGPDLLVVGCHGRSS